MGVEAVSQIATTYLPESNETVMRIYGLNGELIGEQIMAAELNQEAIPRFWHDYGNMWYDRETGTLEWSTTDQPTYYRILDEDIREWDREQDAHHSVYRQEYPQPTLWQHLNTVQSCNAQRLKDLLLGEWKTTEEEPDIKAERGGALDEFLDEFKPQTTPERSDEQE